MTKTRNQGKTPGGSQDNGRRSGSDSEATTGSDQGGGCIQPVKKLIDKYSTPRKGNARPPATPASSSHRRFAPPSSASRSVSRPGTASSTASRVANLNRQFNLQEYDPVEVYCRVKPIQSEESCVTVIDDTTLALIPPDSSLAWKLGTAKEQRYTFQKVFDANSPQKLIFDETALPLVKDFLLGKNALLFAYGVTGSGKTFTMSGSKAQADGIMPRCLDVIFNSISKTRASKYVFKPDRMNGFETQSKADAMLDRQKEMHDNQRAIAKTPRRNGRNLNTEHDMDQYLNRIRDETTLPVGNEDSLYSVFVTYVEIYNNYVYDLLDETPIDEKKPKSFLQQKMLREDNNHNIYVMGVTEVEVESPEEAFEVYLKGKLRRRMAHTALNTESSRSHSIFNIRLVQAPLDSEGEEVVLDNNKLINVSQLSLVDLAGSERYTRTQATGDRLKEAGNINNSLMTLRKCMDILRENQKYNANRVVPFRESKLTHFLKNYFDGEGRVRMILCVNPRNDDYDENLHVMAFAELTQEIQIHRPQEKKFDPMTPGRQKANEMYKEAKRQLVEERIIESNQVPVSDVQMVFGLGIPIPLCKISKSTEEEALATLRKALELRAKGKEELARFIHEKRQSFRLRLLGIERELDTLRMENANYRSHIEKLNAEKERSDSVLRATLLEKGELETKYREQERQIHSLEDELLSCKMELRQRELAHHKEKENLKSDMDVQRELDAMKQERALLQEKAKLKKDFRKKEKTIEAVRELVGEVVDDAPRTRASRSRHSRSAALLDLSTTSSDSDLPSTVPKSDRSSRSRAMSVPVIPLAGTPNIPNTGRRNALLSNPRYGRARSTDRDVWVEHTDRAVIYKPQTVFQPVMKNKRSITKLSTAEDIKGASKYCLVTQEPDSEGDIETRLYKGEINPTITGGANVVLNDVEALRQLSPTGSPTRKRASNTPGPIRSRRSRGLDTDEAITYSEVEERCRMGISSTNLAKNRKRDNE